jgi:hypothetical protein
MGQNCKGLEINHKKTHHLSSNTQTPLRKLAFGSPQILKGFGWNFNPLDTIILQERA